MAKFKGAKWAQILTLMAAIAASIVSEVASAKSYADGLVSAIAAGDVAFTSSNLQSDNVGDALEELFTAVGSAQSNSAVSISTQTTTTGMLRSYTFSQGGSTIGTIDIPKDYVNNIIGIVSQDGSGNSGIFLKVNTAATGADTPVYEYVDVSGLVEYVTSGSQQGDMIFVTVDPTTHQVTATITDGTVTKAKLVQSLQNEITSASKILEVSNIKGLTNAQCEALRAGDIVVKVDGTGKHAYKVSFKTTTGLCMTYADCENVETVAYEKSGDNWAWDSTDVTGISTALQDADFEWATDSEINTAWAAALAEAKNPTPAQGE